MEEFEAAATRVQKLARKPDNSQLLALYSLYKQGSTGDVTGKRPGMLDIRGRAKFDAWAKQKGKSSEQARKEYISLVEKLEKEIGTA